MLPSRCFHGASMVLPWCFHKASMILPWCFHGASMVASMVLPWCVHDAFTKRAGGLVSVSWCFHGGVHESFEMLPHKWKSFMGLTRHVHGAFMYFSPQHDKEYPYP